MYPLAEGLFAPRNQWYIAAWSKEVTRTPMERWILDEPVAFYRREDGTPVAVDGRCPHRSFPLGKSRVVGDNIQCGYHGIAFRPDGSCAEIPTQVTVPKVCRIKSYPVSEQWNWIWIWPGDPALADASLIPDHFEMGLTDPGFRSAGDAYFLVPGRYMLMHDNLLDLTHLGYLHAGSFGADGGGVDQVPEHTDGPNWIESKFTQKDAECPPFFAQMLNYQGRINRTFGLRLFMPCLHYGADTSYRVAADGGNGEMIGSLRIYHGVTPATRTTAHYFFGAGHSWASDDPQSAEKLVENIKPALEEDMSATRYIETMIGHYGDRPSELLLQADHFCVRGRRMFEKFIRAEAEHAPRQLAEAG